VHDEPSASQSSASEELSASLFPYFLVHNQATSWGTDRCS
jgi:hypothetical protein